MSPQHNSGLVSVNVLDARKPVSAGVRISRSSSVVSLLQPSSTQLYTCPEALTAMAKPGPKPKSNRKVTGKRAPKTQLAQTAERPASPTANQEQPAPKRRGRPPKNAPKVNAHTDRISSPAKKATPKRVGKPPKVRTHTDSDPEQHQEQAQSSQVEAQEPMVLEFVGTSIQPSFVIQDPSSPRALAVPETLPGNTEGLLDKLPSKKEAKMAKKLAVKKTKAMKKSTAKKVTSCAAQQHACYTFLSCPFILMQCVDSPTIS